MVLEPARRCGEADVRERVANRRRDIDRVGELGDFGADAVLADADGDRARVAVDPRVPDVAVVERGGHIDRRDQRDDAVDVDPDVVRLG